MCVYDVTNYNHTQRDLFKRPHWEERGPREEEREREMTTSASRERSSFCSMKSNSETKEESLDV